MGDHGAGHFRVTLPPFYRPLGYAAVPIGYDGSAMFGELLSCHL